MFRILYVAFGVLVLHASVDAADLRFGFPDLAAQFLAEAGMNKLDV